MMQKGELREQRFHTGTVELNYAEGPASGEALLYLHGGDGRWQEGRALLEELASAFQVYGLDLRGHGLSGRVPGAYRLQDYVPDVATFLEQVVNRPTVVIGHSMGACGNHARGVLSSPRASTHCGGFSAAIRAYPLSACSHLPECIRTCS